MLTSALVIGLLRQDLPKAEPGHLERFVQYLSSDDMKGRATPSPELDKSADYIAGEFKKAGLGPVGSSYFQEAPAPGSTVDKPPVVRNIIGVLPGSDPELGKTYVVLSEIGRASCRERV